MVGVVVAALVMSAACSGSDQVTPAPSTPSTVPGISLATTVRVAPPPDGVQPDLGPSPGMLIAYEVSNRRAGAIAVVDRLPDGVTMRLQDQPAPLNVLVDVEGTVLVVAKRNVAARNLDYSTAFQGSVVAAGATHRGQGFVRFPLPDFGGTVDPKRLTGWRFCLGVVEEISTLEATADGSVVLVPNGASHLPKSLVCTEPADLPAGARPS